jgi:large subunit ribosomal protein L21|tara:strand:+ start:173 stop:598 length:426 start_codon:yes stop_codon:yes gene_type:complete
MNAIVEISGKQFKVEKDSKLFVHRLEGKEGSKVTFDNVLLLDNGSKVSIGTPTVKGASIQAKILQHVKDNKVIVFKKKRRKGYQVKNGHRQALTEILIEKVNEKSAVKKADVKAEAKKPVAKKAATKKPAAKKSAANSTKK